MNRILRIGSIAVSAAAMTVGLTAPAAASTLTRVTHGDAVAVFQAQSTGGFAAEQHGNHPGQGQPAPLADERAPVVISPISSGPDDPYCALDWHVIRVLLALPSRAELDASQVQIWLDGAPLTLKTTAAKPFASSDFQLYWRSFGIVVAPDALSVGQHQVTATLTLPDGESFHWGTTVTINPADSPACTG